EKNGPAVLTLKRIGKQSTKATVHFATSDGTAKAGADYTASSGDVVFAAGGPETQTISIPIANDHKREPDKTFQVKLTATSSAKVGPQKTATITILDYD
ncbi:MAG: Calx-beta domain-containing protein, partial [Chthoniobacterales bacterium]